MKNYYSLGINTLYTHKRDRFSVTVLNVNVAFDEVSTLTLQDTKTKQELIISFSEFKKEFERI